MNNFIKQYNADFGLDLTFDLDAVNKIVESRKPGEIQKKVLNIFSNISFSNEISEGKSVKKKLITLADI